MTYICCSKLFFLSFGRAIHSNQWEHGNSNTFSCRDTKLRRIRNQFTTSGEEGYVGCAVCGVRCIQQKYRVGTYHSSTDDDYMSEFLGSIWEILPFQSAAISFFFARSIATFTDRAKTKSTSNISLCACLCVISNCHTLHPHTFNRVRYVGTENIARAKNASRQL